MIQHPDPATLLTCSAGSQPEALCAVIASHISMCPECLREFLDLEAIGVALFEGLEPEPMAHMHPAVPGIAQARRRAAPRSSTAEVPKPIRGLLGSDLDALPWVRLLDGVDQYQIPLSADAPGDLRLLRLRPGARLPEHGHQSEELTLVLRGAYNDESGTFRVGDFSDLDDDTRHTVTASEKCECILLIASESRPEFLRHPLAHR